MPTTKIATCCYCGTRAALELRGTVRHELACSSCGAPLHDLKRLPMTEDGRATAPAAAPAHPTFERGKKKKKKKSMKRKVAKGIFDLIEEIFD